MEGLAAVAATALVAGLLIGLTGVGGVLLVPALTEFSGVPVERAIATSMLAFLFAGVLAAFALGLAAGATLAAPVVRVRDAGLG